jgi:2-methylcitrate dehydratase
VDSVTEQLVAYARGFSQASMTATAREHAVDRVADSVACAVVGYVSPPGRIAIEAARGYSSDKPASVFGAGFTTSEELAAFANATMVRSWDWNDGMLAQGGGHPSDMIPAVLAAGETVHASGEQVIDTIVLAYELLGALGNVSPTRAKGFDQGTLMGLSAALAVAKLYDLTEEQMGHAVSLAVVPHVPLRVTRTGNLSMWKGAATASAMHSALVAARLARLGMTGPEEPFEGVSGLWEQATGPWELTLPAQPGGDMVVDISHLKQFPAETHSQALLGLMPRVREFAKADEIESIRIETYWQAYHEIAMHPSKWDPTTRETADHSLPYLLAVALVDGTVTPASFTDERIADPALRPIMAKISVTEDEEFTAGFRPGGSSIAGEPKFRLIVRRHSGEEFVEVVGYHKGHAKNPLSRADIDGKFDAAATGVLEPDTLDRIRAASWSVLGADDIVDVMRVVTDFGGAA